MTEAQMVLKRHRPKVIGITGSVGKTSTKDAVSMLLGQFYDARQSPKSFNSELGLPLTVLGLKNKWHSPVGWLMNIIQGAWLIISRGKYPELLVLEMGVDRPGDFDKTLSWIKPDTAVVTAIGDVPVHVEFFQGPEGVAREKGKLVAALKSSGTAILNADDERVMKLAGRTSAKVITYGMRDGAMVRGSGYRMLVRAGNPYGMTFKLDHDGKTMPVKVEGTIGEQNMYSLLAAAAVGVSHNLNLIEIGEGLSRYKGPPGRLSLIPGANKSLIIDDSYNASPLAVSAALKMLFEIKAPRKIAVLGDMLELGKYTADEHRKVGIMAAKAADIVIAIGMRAKYIETNDIKAYHWFVNSTEAAKYTASIIREGDVVLVKGSQGVRCEKVVEAIMRNPRDAKDLLVRQESYWKHN